jgi:hypothetical protein
MCSFPRYLLPWGYSSCESYMHFMFYHALPISFSFNCWLIDWGVISSYNLPSCCVCITGSEDELAHWWSGVVGVAAYWLLGEDSQAERLYARVETLPECLNEMTDPLPRAVLAAFRSRRASLNLGRRRPGNNPSNKTILRWCNMAGQYLEDSLTYNSCKPANSLVHVSSVISV